VANLRINTPDEIEFQNFRQGIAAENLPYMSAQLGDWEIGDSVEAGIVIDAGSSANYPPILSASDARKLAKWLNRAADALDNVDNSAKKRNKKRSHYAEDDDTEQYRF
jgi:hypothetical protein